MIAQTDNHDFFFLKFLGYTSVMRCKTEGCLNVPKTKNMCMSCYGWVRVHGTDPTNRPKLLLKRRGPSGLFLRKANVQEVGCWEWTGYRVKGNHPYGVYRFNNRTQAAHRVSYQLHKGPIPGGSVVRHKCDNPPCVNPDHLELGTQKDNVQDMLFRGRDRVVGSRNPMAKLNRETVDTIRSEYTPGVVGYKKLAKKYGVSKETIAGIVTKRTWK